MKNNNIGLKINRKMSTARKGPAAPSDAFSSSNSEQPKNPQSIMSDNKVSHIGSILETGSISKNEELK